jgi:hypothetical protein
MAEIPKVEPQSTGHVLRERKEEVVAAKKALEASKLVVAQVQALIKQNEFYEREIDGARGRIFMLLVAQTRNAEVASSEEYLSKISEAIDALTGEDKKAKKE